MQGVVVVLNGRAPDPQELIDHTTATQNALAKLLVSVMDSEKGRHPSLLSANGPSLFEAPDTQSLHSKVADLEKKVRSLLHASLPV